MEKISKILKSADLFFIGASTFTYLLGAVLAQRAGSILDLNILLLGLLFFLSLYLLERNLNYLTSSRINVFSTASRSNRLQSPEMAAFLLFLSFLLLFCLYGLIRAGGLSGNRWIWLAFLSVGILINASSIRLWTVPYRWLTDALVVAPVMLFSGAILQRIPSERMLFFLSLPLFFLYLASTAALMFEKFDSDAEKGRYSLLTAIGWEKTMNLHHGLIIAAYIALGVYFFVSGSWPIAWPAALLAILSLFEVFQLERIARGLKPLWGVLRATAVLQYLGLLYMLLFAFLIN
ncbi:MAG: hypothetical protein AAGU04_08070 [Anaerolineaceae bacterium]